ncbi:hypothetical protein R3I93_016040 [Phoxinus phoxinus]|uniref:Protein LYRIC-like n=1 Tax=Phoxinus phoxinus TaxID=58324 RepID=A0AAN9GXV1_9TELE
MDQDWRTLATQRAEYVSDRIRGLLSSGLDFLRAELGVDLGIKPEQYPSWLILSTALVGLIVLVVLAACGRKKRRAVPVTVSPSTVAEIPVKTALPPKTVKTEPSEPKKKNKKKASDKKAQANGQTVAEPQQEIKVTEEKKKKPPPSPAPAPAQPQPPADTKTKKNKKKPKPEVKPTKAVSSTDGKEPEEAGAWETKVSNREKRQQRKKEKGPGDSPEAGDHASQKVEQPVVTATAGTKKNKESSRAKAGKGDVITAPVTSNCNDVNSVNGGGLMEEPVKSTQTSALNNEKWSTGRKTLGQKNRDNSTWKIEPEGAWTSLDGKMKAEPNSVNLTMLRLNPSGGETRIKSNIEIGKWDNTPIPDNEWSSSNGLSSVDPSSDWNAPAELWGNYEPKVDAPALKEIPVSNPLVLQESNDDKDQADPAGSGKSKRRKKKKRPEEEGSTAEVTQEGSAPAEKSVTVKLHPPHVPKDEGSKQNIPPQSSSKKSDQNWEPPKQVQKKKARRET